MLKSIFKFLIFGFIFSFNYLNVFSQNLELTIQSKDSSNSSIIQNIAFNKFHSSKNNIYQELDSISQNLSIIGFLNNEYLLSNKDSVFTAIFELHQKTELVRVYYPNKLIDLNFIKKIALNSTDLYFEIQTTDIEETLNNIINYFENEGHSFTNASLINIQQKDNLLIADLKINISPKRKIDNIRIKGYPEFPKKYIEHYLEIDKNTLFNTNSLDKIEKLINTIPFVQQLKKPEVLFTKDSTTLYLYVKKKSNSNFDGIIGFSNEEDNGKIRFNGYLDVKLNNTLNKGETFTINWQNSQNKNSSLNLNLQIPYIFNSRINFIGEFNIFRQDTIYNNTIGLLHIGYSLNHNNFINIIGSTEKSNLNSTTNTDSSNLNNFSKNMLGLSYNYKLNESSEHVNRYRFIAEAGYLIGQRKNEDDKTQQNRIQFLIEYYAHFNSRNTIFIKTDSKILISTNTFENELFRIGGFNSIRGFNENSILTSKYNVTNLEYHYKTNNSSYLYTITDFAILNNPNTNTTTQLYGLGLGYYLSTNKVILNLSYALGKNYKIPLNFNNSKVHIKLTYPF